MLCSDLATNYCGFLSCEVQERTCSNLNMPTEYLINGITNEGKNKKRVGSKWWSWIVGCHEMVTGWIVDKLS